MTEVGRIAGEEERAGAVNDGAAPTRVALIGAGFIAAVHLRVLAYCEDAEVVALCDTDAVRAEALARSCKIERVHTSLDELIETGGFEAAHVLVPPGAHEEVTRRLLEAGVHVLVEKPMALRAASARALGELAAAKNLCLGVNHNMTFHPLVQRLEDDLHKGRLGRIEHVGAVHHVPLRQLDSGDVSHFMFASEANILLEQVVHPLSVVMQLLGPAEGVDAQVGEARTLPNGARFFDTWHLALRCQRGTAQLFCAFGRDMLETTLQVIGSDGAVRIDLQRGTYQRLRKTRWLEFWDTAWNGIAGGFGLIVQGLASAGRWVAGLFGFSKLPDPFLQGMGASIEAFHQALRHGQSPAQGAEAAVAVLSACEMAATAAGARQDEREPRPLPEPGPAREGEVLVTGGTGFLGRHLVQALQDAGQPVTLLVRRPDKLPDAMRADEKLRLFVGDARDARAVGSAIAGVTHVVHMATCAGEDPQASMRAGIETVARACVDAGVQRLVFVSTTAALYLGGHKKVDGSHPPDPRPAGRAAYARGKIAAELELARIAADSGLTTVVLRPAIVVGDGGMLNHSGIGLWVRDNQCIGWGMRRPLPLVLASDVADAIVAALSSPAAAGKAYNLAGPVRPTADAYVARLAAATGRDLRYRPQPIALIWVIEVGKWLVKCAARRGAPFPSWRDFKSRGFFAPLDCSDAVADLGWTPQADPEAVFEEALRSHRPDSSR